MESGFKKPIVVVMLAGMFALAGCTGTTTVVTTTAPDTSATVECREVGPDVSTAIAAGASDLELTPTGRVAAVDAPEPLEGYLVAVEFDVAGFGYQTGVWTTAAIDGDPAPIARVDEIAQQNTTWPDAANADDPAVAAAAADAIACLG